MNKISVYIVLLTIISGCVTYPNPNNTYQNLPYPKAKAVAVKQNGQYWQLTGGWGVATANSEAEASMKAILNCERYNPKGSCVIEKINDMNLLNKNLAKLKLQPTQPRSSSQGVDWARAAGVIGKQILDMEEARTRPPPTPPKPRGMLYFYDSETISGMNKICFYKNGGSFATKTVRSTDLCPRSIEV